MRVAHRHGMTRASVFPALAALFACGGEPSPVVVGTVSSGVSISEPLTIEVNGHREAIELEADRRFAVYGLPTGDLVLGFKTRDASGTLTLRNVAPGERIEVRIDGNASRLTIHIVRREKPERDVDVDSDTDRKRKKGLEDEDEDWGAVVSFPEGW